MTLTKKAAARFWKKVGSGADNECWLWTAGKDTNGYGRFNVGQGKIVGAHRVSYILAYGPILHFDSYHGGCVCHHCDVPACVNPEHLFLGSMADNLRDRNAKGRANMPTGESNPASKLTWAKVEEIRRLRQTRAITLKALGEKFGVSHVAILKIIGNKTWLQR